MAFQNLKKMKLSNKLVMAIMKRNVKKSARHVLAPAVHVTVTVPEPEPEPPEPESEPPETEPEPEPPEHVPLPVPALDRSQVEPPAPRSYYNRDFPDQKHTKCRKTLKRNNYYMGRGF